jgi:AbrB family looped-hinge helix DNA binding protein
VAKIPLFVTVRSRGLIAIPASIRRHFGLEQPGAQVEVIVREDEIVLPHTLRCLLIKRGSGPSVGSRWSARRTMTSPLDESRSPRTLTNFLPILTREV